MAQRAKVSSRAVEEGHVGTVPALDHVPGLPPRVGREEDQPGVVRELAEGSQGVAGDPSGAVQHHRERCGAVRPVSPGHVEEAVAGASQPKLVQPRTGLLPGSTWAGQQPRIRRLTADRPFLSSSRRQGVLLPSGSPARCHQADTRQGEQIAPRHPAPAVQRPDRSGNEPEAAEDDGRGRSAAEEGLVAPVSEGLQVKVGSSVVTFGAGGATVEDGASPPHLVKTQAGTRSAM